MINISDNKNYNYPVNVIMAIGMINPQDIPENAYELFEKVIHFPIFTDRDREAIYGYFRDGYTLKELAIKFERTPERIRQLINKNLRRLYNYKNIIIGVEPLIKRKEELIKEIAILEYKLTELKKEYLKKSHETNIIIDDKPIEIYIKDLDFSVRTYNCLYRAGVTTVSELKEYSIYNLTKIRNLGKHGITEIRDKMHSLGYKLKDE